MNARRNFYSSIFEQISEYRSQKQEKKSSLFEDRIVQLGLFASVLTFAVFGGLNFDIRNYFQSTQIAMPQVRVVERPASDLFNPDLTSASEGDVPPGTEGAFVVRPSDDGYVSEDSADKSYASEGLLVIDSAPVRIAYLKFKVPTTEQFSKAVLRLYPKDGNQSGGKVSVASSNLWSESLLTFDSRPSAQSTVATISTVSPNTPVDIDVSSVVAAGKTVTFVLESSSEDMVRYASKEDAAMPPQLLLSE